MEINQAANFLAGSILTGLGFIIVVAVAIAINNIIHKFWKPIQFTKWLDYPPLVASEPQLEAKTTKKRVVKSKVQHQEI